ncbi:uncharacterized protein PV09_07854 [Verruconis gallopava]|uniref:Uncharacterized protein n=1 Tax=Verruconis gallopava TaxID=253628 RepID=A0A0D1YII1_9PEZI|nr:uncharacterized protein PV09_07854 [Verruconis gallopava]KIW00667.1 hypothetical protein PV09_07854 [Verruconis gallopava]
MLVKRIRGRPYFPALCFFCTILFFLYPSELREQVLDLTPLKRDYHGPRHPLYKPRRNATAPIVDNFPLASAAKTRSDLPPIPSWNLPPDPHVPEKTPILIGFTRNWLLLQQAVLSYITAGWPPEDIYVVENTGTMNSNKLGRLSLQNPFYLNYDRLTKVFGVNVISTPTYLTFSQLQNFYLHLAIENEWDYYFWGHMDVIAVSEEDYKDPATGKYESLYMRSVQDLRKTVNEYGRRGRWAIRFYAYDRMALVNRYAFEEVGGWDTQIPYYGSDCDMHERLSMAGFKQEDARNGLVYDIGTPLDDVSVLFRRTAPSPADAPEAGKDEMRRDFSVQRWGREDTLASPAWKALTDRLHGMQHAKNHDARGRNTWQSRQTGGQGEPYYKDPDGFEQAILMTIEFGRNLMAEKWGHRGCNLRAAGLGKGDEWRVRHDWESRW